MTLAVADAGPLIHLAEVDSLALLSVVDDLLVPQTVYDELQADGLPRGLEAVASDIVESPDELEVTSALDPGERAAIEVAREQDAVLLTDDLEARDAAKEVGVEVHGSIGIIAMAYSRSSISEPEAIELIRALHTETSLFVTDAVVERGINLIEERS